QIEECSEFEPDDCSYHHKRELIKTVLTQESGKLYLIKYIPKEFLETAEFPVYTDLDISYGTAEQFSDTNEAAYYTRVTEVNTNKFVVCYNNSAIPGVGSCRAGTVSGTDITWGAINQFVADMSVGTPYIGLDKINTDKFALSYLDDDQSDEGYTRIGTTTGGTTINYGTATNVRNGSMQFSGLGQITTDYYAIAYTEGFGFDGYAVVCTDNNGTPDCGAESEFADAINSAQYNQVCPLNGTDTFVVNYHDDAAANWEARAADTTGTTIDSWGTNLILDNGGNGIYGGCDNIDTGTSQFVSVWGSFNNNYGLSVMCTVDASEDLTCGTQRTFGSENGDMAGNAVTKIDGDNFVISGEDRGDSEKGVSIYSSYSGTTITQGSEEDFHVNQTQFTAIDLISANKVVICYQD
ncbi:unnamed protein product, partial [marine sediment metagenome]